MMPLMSRRSACLFGFAALFLFVTSVAAQAPVPLSIAPQDLGRIWDAEHVSPPQPPAADRMPRSSSGSKRWSQATPSLFRMEKIGESVEGRAINMVEAGTGAFPRAAVVADARRRADRDGGALRRLRIPAAASRRRRPCAASSSSLTLYVRADAESRRRRALPAPERAGHRHQPRRPQLQTPEGRTLKAVRDRLQPRVGFNLHNQSWRTSVGDPPKPASISLLSVAYDKARSGSEGRTLTKKICAVIRDALEPFASGPDRALRRRVRSARVRRQPDAVGHAGGADRNGTVAGRRARSRAGAAEFRRHSRRARCAGHRCRRTAHDPSATTRCR